MDNKLENVTIQTISDVLGERKWHALRLYFTSKGISINNNELQRFYDDIEQTSKFEQWFNNLCSYPHMSNSVSKLGTSIVSLNLPAGITCRPNAPCKKGCYACKGNFCFKTVSNGIMNNYYSYLLDPQHFFDIIDCNLKLVPYKFLRWHSSGDIIDTRYLEGMCQIALLHPGTQCLCFSKQYEIINEYFSIHAKPQNLTIVLSSWGSFIPENPHNLPTAWVKLRHQDSYIPSDARECSKYCGDCALGSNSCWNLQSNESIVFHQH